MTFTCEIDLYHKSTISDILSTLEKYDSPTIIQYQSNGPAGGNPNITLQFSDYDTIFGFLTSFYKNDSDFDFINKKIIKT